MKQGLWRADVKKKEKPKEETRLFLIQNRVVDGKEITQSFEILYYLLLSMHQSYRWVLIISDSRILIADFEIHYEWLVEDYSLLANIHMGQFPQDGGNGQNVFFLELCCDQMVWFFNFSQMFLRFWLEHSNNVFVLVLAHLEPDVELFEVDDVGDDGDDDLLHHYLPNFKQL